MDTRVSPRYVECKATQEKKISDSLRALHRYDPTIGNGLHVPLRHETPPMLQDSLKLTRNVHESEDSYSVTRVVDGRSYYLSLTDTAGQEEYRGLWAASNLRSDAFLLVYDITAGPSLDALDYFLQMIQMESDHRQDSGAVPPVKIVAGNKCDLKEGRVISSRQGLEWARAKGCGFMETSAREMVNIEETFACKIPSWRVKIRSSAQDFKMHGFRSKWVPTRLSGRVKKTYSLVESRLCLLKPKGVH